jgi:DnaJ-class molecular chaperone
MSKCNRCSGSGFYNSFECVKCNGKGRISKQDLILFLIAKNPIRNFSFRKPAVIDNHQEAKQTVKVK